MVVQVHYLQVGEKHFALTNEDLEKLESPFLSTLLDSSTPYCKPVDGIYKVEEADERCFASFLLFAQYGVWTMIHTDVDFCLQQADFWGIREKIQEQIQEQVRIADQNKQLWKQSLEKVYRLQNDVAQVSIHHNFRSNDEHGKVNCSSCGTRGFDSRLRTFRQLPCCYCEHDKQCSKIYNHEDQNTTDCRGYGARITFKTDLGWCHKCSMCTKCQTGECPADHPVPNRENYYKDSLHDVKMKLELAEKELACLH